VLYDMLKGDGRKAQDMQLQGYIDNKNATVHTNKLCLHSVIMREQFKRSGHIYMF